LRDGVQYFTGALVFSVGEGASIDCDDRDPHEMEINNRNRRQLRDSLATIFQ